MKEITEPYFLKRYTKFCLDIQKEINSYIPALRFIFMPILGILLILILDPDNHPERAGIFIIMLAIGLWYGGKIFAYILTKLYNSYIGYVIRNIQSLTTNINNYIEKTQTIEEVLIKLESIYKMNTYLQLIQRKIENKSIFRNKYGGLTEETLEWIIGILTDLRSDLSIRLTEQQSTLESAKSEVEKNITGTTELNQVSELQRARLDRQIEQFEELQRVLVKV